MDSLGLAPQATFSPVRVISRRAIMGDSFENRLRPQPLSRAQERGAAFSSAGVIEWKRDHGRFPRKHLQDAPTRWGTARAQIPNKFGRPAGAFSLAGVIDGKSIMNDSFEDAVVAASARTWTHGAVHVAGADHVLADATTTARLHMQR